MLYVFLLFFQKCLSDCIDHFSQTYCKCRQNFENDNADRCRINVQFECKGIRRILTETNFNFKILVHVILMYYLFQNTNVLALSNKLSLRLQLCVPLLYHIQRQVESYLVHVHCHAGIYIYLQKHKLKLYEHRSDS